MTPRGRATRSGAPTETAPGFSAVTTVSCSPAGSGRVARNSARSAVFAGTHGSVDPVGPWKHATFWIAPAGPATDAVTTDIGPPHVSAVTLPNHPSVAAEA